MFIDGVEIHEDSRAEIEIDGVLYIHGWMTGIGKHAKYFNQSVVHGHTHVGGLWTQNLKKKFIFELDCGYLADPYQVPLTYRATKTTNWTKGFGFIDSWGPRFCPL